MTLNEQFARDMQALREKYKDTEWLAVSDFARVLQIASCLRSPEPFLMLLDQVVRHRKMIEDMAREELHRRN